MGIKSILVIFLLMFSFTFISAYEPHPVDNNYTYGETVANADYCNLTGIKYPDGTKGTLGFQMTKDGFDFTANITSGNFSQIGDTCWDILCYDSDADPQYESGTKCLTVNRDGSSELTQGKSNVLLVALAIMVIISFFFIFLGSRMEGWAWKIILFGTAGLILMMGVLYSMVLIDQVLADSADLIQGYTTFLMVMKVITGLAITMLVLFGLYKAFIMWQIKRGFRDD